MSITRHVGVEYFVKRFERATVRRALHVKTKFDRGPADEVAEPRFVIDDQNTSSIHITDSLF